MNDEFEEFAQAGALALLPHAETVGYLLRGEMPPAPVQIELHPSSECGAHCPWCSEIAFRKAYPGHLDLDLLYTNFAELKMYGLKGVVLTGSGEPTEHPEIQKLIYALTDLGLAVGMVTNGWKLLPPGIVGRLSWVRVSMDFWDKGLFEKYRGGDYDEVVSNTLAMAEYTDVGVSYAVSTLSEPGRDLNRAIEVWYGGGLRYVLFKAVIDDKKYEPEKTIDLERVIDRYQTHKFQIKDAQSERYTTGNCGLPCLTHVLSPVIAPTWDIFICCRLHETNVEGGRVARVTPTATFMTWWQSVIYKGVWEAMKNYRNTEKMCPDCRMTKYNVLLNDVINEGRAFV